ncbi:MAG: glycosyl transferase [Candidatus Melainabacteria bacterium]|mgnify:FL=1|nr:MAG: glycosyl transferase [Candidatus Melainabacteria bacterium]
MKKITVLIPVYNELNTLEIILKKVEETNLCGLEKEIILIDDYSTDGTRDILKKLESKYKVLYHDKNMGKGAALKTGFANMTGDIVIIQDADLEYEPKDYENLVKEVYEGNADIVYGSRLMGKPDDSFIWTHLWGNRLITFVANILYGQKLTDIETCYKVFRRELLDGVDVKSHRFDFEPEITAKMLKKKAKFMELPISYSGRGHDEGKKITWKDGFGAIWALIKYRFVD